MDHRKPHLYLLWVEFLNFHLMNHSIYAINLLTPDILSHFTTLLSWAFFWWIIFLCGLKIFVIDFSFEFLVSKGDSFCVMSLVLLFTDSKVLFSKSYKRIVLMLLLFSFVLHSLILELNGLMITLFLEIIHPSIKLFMLHTNFCYCLLLWNIRHRFIFPKNVFSHCICKNFIWTTIWSYIQ